MSRVATIELQAKLVDIDYKVATPRQIENATNIRVELDARCDADFLRKLTEFIERETGEKITY